MQFYINKTTLPKINYSPSPPVSTYYLLLITHYSLLITHYLLLITHYLLLITHYLLLITHYLLLITHYLLLITYYLLLITCPQVPQSSHNGCNALDLRIKHGDRSAI